MSKDAYCPPGKEPDKDDTPIGSMMKGMMKGKINSKMPPKKKDGAAPSGKMPPDFVRG